jgi:hypothetical protein
MLRSHMSHMSLLCLVFHVHLVLCMISYVHKKFKKATNKSCDWSEDATTFLLQCFEEKFLAIGKGYFK